MSVLTPESVDDLAAALADASASTRTVRVEGGGTRSRRGRPHEPDAVLSTSALAGVVDYEPADMTVTVRAGTAVELLQHELEAHGQAWPAADTRPGSTVGGILATGASGLSRLRYGPVRDSLLEVVIVTGDGRRVAAGARTVKSVAGYDLPRLMVGADGTLGVIAQVTLRLWPLPTSSGWSRTEGTLPELTELAEHWVGHPSRPLAVAVTPDALWVHAGGEELPEGLEHVPSGPPRPSGGGIVQMGVPPPALAAALSRLAADDRDFRAQAGVGVIEVAVDDAGDVATARALATSLGGHAIVIDGPPEMREDPFGPIPSGVEIMRRLRDQFDPAGVVNPGCVPWDPRS